jgi:hypothetical protein
MRGIWLVLIALGLSSVASATPWFTQDPRTLPQGKWRVEEHVLYSDVDDALVDGDRVPFAAIEDFTSLTLHTRVRYGATDDLTVFVDVPYVRKRVTGLGGVETTNDGLGDLFFLAKYKYHDSKRHRLRQAAFVALKAENGEAEGLPGPLALGTGTTDWTFGHLWEKGLGEATGYASVGYTLTGDRDDLGTDPGDAIFFNVAAEHPIGHQGLQFVWEINGRHTGSTEAGGGTVPNTDSLIVAFSPGVQYVRRLKSGPLQLEAGVQIPVYMQGDAPAIPNYTAYVGGFIVF